MGSYLRDRLSAQMESWRQWRVSREEGLRLKLDVTIVDDGSSKEKMDLINNCETKSIIGLAGLIVYKR